MKNTLLQMIKTLLYPLTACRQILLEASENLCEGEPLGLSDYLNYVEAEKICRQTPHKARSHSLQVSLNYARRG